MVVEPDTEVVQRYPRCQPRPQTLKVVGTLSPEAENIEQLVINRLDDLAGIPTIHFLSRLDQGLRELRLGGWMTSAP